MRWIVVTALFAAACDKEPEEVFVAFNQEGDVLSVEVTASEDLGEPVSTELLSSTGTVVVGTATIDPGSGPVGTDHELTVNVLDDWEEVVRRVTVLADAGERGADEYELRQDSADHGVWVLTLTSLGADEEERTDTFTITLWQLAELEVEVPEDAE